MKFVIFSAHCWQQKRRAGFHHLSQALMDTGHDVLFYSLPVSWMLYVKKNDHRIAALSQTPPNQLQRINNRLSTLIHWTFTQPIKAVEPLGFIFHWLYKSQTIRKAAVPFIAEADVAIFESSAALYLHPALKRINPGIKIIYRVSDDLRAFNASDYLLKIEKKFAKETDMISVPSTFIYNNFSHLPQARLHFHGVSKTLFAKRDKNPYSPKVVNVVFIGVANFNEKFIEIASELKVAWQFHVIGPFKQNIMRSNVTYYGEMPFEKTIPYIKYASIGLHGNPSGKGAESFTDSLKVLQYTYCKLSIIAPNCLKTERPNTFYYAPNNQPSIAQALDAAAKYHHADDGYDYRIKDWQETAQLLMDDLNNN